MTSNRRRVQPPHPDSDASISERAATAAQAAAYRARDGVSRVLRAREVYQFSLDSGRPDVRGWQVLSKDGDRIGVVTSLLIDTRVRTIRYLGISLDAAGSRPVAEVLVPIGWTSRPDDQKVVVVHALSLAQLAAAPRVPNRPIKRADELAALTAYGMSPSTDDMADELYHNPMFDEWRLFGGPGSRAALG